MSKKVIKWLIADIVFAIVLTTMIILVGKIASQNIKSESLKTIIFYVKTAAWIIIDLTILFCFLLYWWADREWMRIKRRVKKK